MRRLSRVCVYMCVFPKEELSVLIWLSCRNVSQSFFARLSSRCELVTNVDADEQAHTLADVLGFVMLYKMARKESIQ